MLPGLPRRPGANLPDVPPLDVEGLAQAVELHRVYGAEPPLPQAPLKLAKDAVGANEIFPFQKNEKVAVTHLLADVVGGYKDLLLRVAKMQSGGGIAAEAPLLMDLLTDSLASMGLRYTNMNSTALCSPSRAALITGRNHHSTGFGVVAEQATGFPG
jgi:hypothetical protein